MNIGEYLRETRLKNKIKVLEIATELGVSSQYIGHMEREKAPIPTDYLARWIDFVGASRKKSLKIIVMKKQREIEKALRL